MARRINLCRTCHYHLTPYGPCTTILHLPLTWTLQEERQAWELQDPESRPSSLPTSFDCLRAVPGYSAFIKERFERCLDLYLCPRARRRRPLVQDPESLVPQLPSPRDLRPFPTSLMLRYLGHTASVSPPMPAPALFSPPPGHTSSHGPHIPQPGLGVFAPSPLRALVLCRHVPCHSRYPLCQSLMHGSVSRAKSGKCLAPDGLPRPAALSLQVSTREGKLHCFTSTPSPVM